MDLPICVVSYYKLVKDLVEKISKNSSSSTRFILLIFSTRYFNSNLFYSQSIGFCSVYCDCEPGWFEYYGNCYYISATRLRYNDYERTCTARNATVYTWQSKADLVRLFLDRPFNAKLYNDTT